MAQEFSKIDVNQLLRPDGMASEAWTDKALREVQLLGAGVSGFGEAAVDALSAKNLPETAEKVVGSALLGLALTRLAPTSGVLGLAARAGGTAMGLSFLADIAGNGAQMAGTMSDAWSSDLNWNKDVSVMKNTVGKFVFDSALMTVGGLSGAKLGGRFFEPISGLAASPRELPPRIKELNARPWESLTEAEDIELSSYHQFPDNPRLQELAGKERLQQLTVPEGAELFSYRQYPTNPEMRELARREITGEIGDSDKELLRKANVVRYRAEKYTPQFSALMDRAEAGDPQALYVTMSEGKSTIVPANAATETQLFTNALSGCTATSLVVPLADGSNFTALTHYPPTEQLQNANRLRQMIGGIDRPIDATKQASLLVMEPEEFGRTQPYDLQPAGKSNFSRFLELTVAAALKGNVSTHFEPYSNMNIFGAKDQGTLVTTIKPGGAANWKTWSSDGNLTPTT